MGEICASCGSVKLRKTLTTAVTWDLVGLAEGGGEKGGRYLEGLFLVVVYFCLVDVNKNPQKCLFFSRRIIALIQ
jgi:hypothetical protein